MVNRTLLFFLVIALSLTLFSFAGNDPKPPKQTVIRTIVVDAGHGIMENGRHNGAKGSFSYEDEICLAVSKELIRDINREFPEIKIVETRPTEKIVALHKRADIANENKGDLFVCIHVNSAPAQRKSELIGHKKVTYYTGKGKNRKKKTKDVPQYRYYTVPSAAKGTETYIWGAHKNDEKELAMRENAQMFDEANFEKYYGSGFDPNSPEFIAVSLLKTKQYFKRSATLAGLIQDEFTKVGRFDRDVKQRGVGIWVLQATAMPSVLIETGFISNPEEERYLNSVEGQKELSQCIIKALKNYVSWLERQQQGVDPGTAYEKNSPGESRNTSPKEVSAFLQMVEENEKKNAR
ncbi:MAG: N-acetylmuramoyl-L-alanine amidase [Chitinophagaceae bacterium]